MMRKPTIPEEMSEVGQIVFLLNSIDTRVHRGGLCKAFEKYTP